jgi:CcmD family protein
MRILTVLSILLLAVPGSVPAGAQEAGAPAASSTADQIPAPAPGDAALQSPSQEPAFTAVPLGNVQPRTLRSYWHLFIAFAVTWVLVFGYALSIGRRFARLESEVRELRGRGTPAA